MSASVGRCPDLLKDGSGRTTGIRNLLTSLGWRRSENVIAIRQLCFAVLIVLARWVVI